MVVYIEFLFLENLFLDYFLFTITSAILKRKGKKSRIFFSALFFALLSSVLPFFYEYELYCKIFCVIVIPICIVKNKNFVEYCTVLCVFICVTLTLGGAIYCIRYSLGSYFLSSNDFSVLTALTALCGILTVKLCSTIVDGYRKSASVNEKTYDVTITCNGLQCKTEGFYDSGNRVYTKNGEPVSIVDYSIYNRFEQEEDVLFVSTVAGTRKLFSKECEMKIYLPGDGNILCTTRIASAPDVRIREGVILHGDTFGGG